MNAIARPTLQLTRGQQAAFDAFVQFLLDPHDDTFVLAGYSGTGKSTLVSHLLDRLPKIVKSARLINPGFGGWDVALTATTNKAAEALSNASGRDVVTIHSFLGLRVRKDYKTGKSSLVPKDRHDIKDNMLIFIDEASYIDDGLLRMIFAQTKQCKLVFMGDPAQLSPVGSSATPVFSRGFKGAHLSEVVRQAKGNPIIEVSTRFREAVTSGEFFAFKPDGNHTIWLPRMDFNQAIETEFTRPDWHHNDSKILAWTNKRVIDYNHAVNLLVQGTPDFQVGDYAICNHYLQDKSYALKTDQMVQITGRQDGVSDCGVDGRLYQVDHRRTVFMPNELVAREPRIKQAREEDDYDTLRQIDDHWADLRAAYACTINKSQGSTYNQVFIDLDDIARCHDGNQMARMLYVAVSRARDRVTFTGDLV